MYKINLVYYWWGGENFGDYLSPFIVEKMIKGDVQIIRKRVFISNDFYYRFFKLLVRKLLRLTSEKISDYLKPGEKSLLAIGSILTYSNKNSLIWGSGFMNENETFHGGTILAVRGRKTNEKIIAAGGKGCTVWGDPALLLPLFILPAKEQGKFPLGVIPHWRETSYFEEMYSDSCKVINLNTSEIEYVVREITSCKAILSSSLHGIIVAHAYGIPAIWIKRGYIDTDGFKFADYFSSVNIDFYPGFENYDELIRCEDSRNKLFKKNIALPNVDLYDLQQQLIRVFPY
ncbi:polysaccharide pyruvyl transferase family protein [Phocaeicola plebeius]|uniref:polysaccharide pyruvyl transferase family protein n=1 Tax=Phocaeicola plebeius TaxID=310297 RepID=UPI0026E9763F|nr:polysaccharide pyruvyl transferase family protein [Phocaeicola plebeius]